MTDRVENRLVRISDSVKLVSLERSTGLAPLQECRPADLTKAHLHDQVEMAARFAEREPGRGEQGFGRFRLEYPPHALLGCTTAIDGSP